MKEFYIGQNFKITQQAYNNGISLIDITNASISCLIKHENKTLVLTKKNSLAGGSDNECLITDPTKGIFELYVAAGESYLLSPGIYNIATTIIIGSNTYLLDYSFLIKGSDNELLSVYTVDKTTDLTYAQLVARIASDNLIPSQKIKILNFSGTTGLIVTAKTIDTLEPLAYLENSDVAYIYDVSSNTITPLSEIVETFENKTMDGENNNFINIPVYAIGDGTILSGVNTGDETENTLKIKAGITGDFVGDSDFQILENKNFICSDNNFINQTEVTYFELTTLISTNSLKMGNKYLITDFQETWDGGSKPVEQIIVTASSPNTLERVASSVTNPNDYIEYTVSNNLISGATKGVILYRKDISSNEYSINCRSITLGYGSYRNKFGIDCYSITLGITSSNNNFGNDCKQTTVGESCSFNEFGQSCYNNTIGSSFKNNKLNNECFSNVFGNSYRRNEFIDCQYRNFTTTYAAFEPYLQGNYYCKVYKLSDSKLCLEYTNIDGQTVKMVI